MSLAINVATAEGLVLSADSRQSYRNQKGQARIGSDSASKVFKLSSKVGATVTGPAFLPEKETLKNVSKFIDDFKRETDVESLTVEKTAKSLHSFFDKKYPYKKQLEKIPGQLKKQLEVQGGKVIEITPKESYVEFKFRDPSGAIRTGKSGPEQLSFIVSGYNKDGTHATYIAYVTGEIEEKRNSLDKKKEYGASWTGQIGVVARIVLGRDPKTIDVLMLRGLLNPGINEKKVADFFRGLQYAISWGTMTLQDAIDFASLMIETTSAIQRFSDGIAMDPGDIPGVGGPIDIAVITPDKGFVWVAKKKLEIGENSLDLEQIPNLEKTTPAKSSPTPKKRAKKN